MSWPEAFFYSVCVVTGAWAALKFLRFIADADK